jgi:oligopeptide/dipeptide ABC transporter ATP-binding protein
MYAGRIVELASVEELFDHPRHPYTVGLFQSVPVLGRQCERLATIPGAVPNPARLPGGCKFHPRCERTCQLAQGAGEAETTSVRVDGEERRVMRRCVEEEAGLCECADAQAPTTLTPALSQGEREKEALSQRDGENAHLTACHFAEEGVS